MKVVGIDALDYVEDVASLCGRSRFTVAIVVVVEVWWSFAGQLLIWIRWNLTLNFYVGIHLDWKQKISRKFVCYCEEEK